MRRATVARRSNVLARTACVSTVTSGRTIASSTLAKPQSTRNPVTAVFSSKSSFSFARFYADLPSHNKVGLPALSPTMLQGNLAAWKKKEGDKISPGDVIAEVETDKATMDWEATEEGYVAKLLIAPGTKDITVGRIVMITVDDANDVAKFANFTMSDQPAAAPKPAAPEAPKVEQKAAPAAAPAAPAPQPQAAPQPAASGRVAASPFAKKVASELNVNVAAVPGTGPNGRVVAADVAEYVARITGGAAVPVSAPSAEARPAVAGAAFTDFPNTNIRKVIARRLSESKQTIPHYYLTVECRVDKLLKVREELNSRGDGKYKISVNDFIIKASALALRKQPVVNSSWSEEAIRRYHNVDINVAVNTPEGLFTPIVPDADKKGLLAISNNVKELATKAKEKKLTPQDYEGGTFTISNLGMFGIKQFAAVINPPQAAILAVGSTEKRVVFNEDAATAKTRPYEEANILTVTLSCDHRVIDGAVGAEWLQAFKGYMEDPLKMLL